MDEAIFNNITQSSRGLVLQCWSNKKFYVDKSQKEFQTKIRLLRDNNEIVAEILNIKKAKDRTVRAYSR